MALCHSWHNPATTDAVSSHRLHHHMRLCKCWGHVVVGCSSGASVADEDRRVPAAFRRGQTPPVPPLACHPHYREPHLGGGGLLNAYTSPPLPLSTVPKTHPHASSDRPRSRSLINLRGSSPRTAFCHSLHCCTGRAKLKCVLVKLV